VNGTAQHDTALYLYCLTPPGSVLELSHSNVVVEELGSARAVLREVRREEFAGQEAEERLKDLAWLAPRAALHEALVEQVMSQVPVLPAPFATLFESRESVRRFLLEHAVRIAGFFRSLGNKREWAVKGFLDRAHLDPEPDPGLDRESAGKSYLEKRRVQAAQREAARRDLRAACEQSAVRLKEQAQDFRERKVWKANQAANQLELIFNWAFLLPAGEEAAFRQHVAKLNEQEQHRALGLSLVISGPWPPYSFAPPLGPGGAA
jgi:gas vesicle protein GvpL/GvpF